MTKHAELVQENPDFDQRKFLYRLSRAEYDKEWGTQYQKPGWPTRLFAAFVSILPKIGPLKNVDIKLPTPVTEDLYIKSVNKTVDSYKAQLIILRQNRNHIDLPNLDFDTGNPTRPEEYKLADANLRQAGAEIGRSTSSIWSRAGLQANLMALSTAIRRAHRRATCHADEWNKVQSAVSDLKGLQLGTIT